MPAVSGDRQFVAGVDRQRLVSGLVPGRSRRLAGGGQFGLGDGHIHAVELRGGLQAGAVSGVVVFHVEDPARLQRLEDVGAETQQLVEVELHQQLVADDGVELLCAQVVAQAFQVDLARVKITSTVTDKVPNTSATAASSGADLNGMAAFEAARAAGRAPGAETPTRTLPNGPERVKTFRDAQKLIVDDAPWIFLLFERGFQQTVATTLGGVLAVLAPALGPISGGLLTENFSWHWLFLINVAPGITTFAVGLLCLPRVKPALGLLAHLDWVSVLIMALGLAALEIGLKEAPDRGWASAPVLALLAIVALAIVFVVRRPRPAIDFSLFSDRNFTFGCGVSFLLGFGIFGSVYLMPVFLAFVRNHGPVDIGLIILVTGIAQLVSAPIAVQVDRRFPARMLSAIGFAAFAIGLAMSTTQTVMTDYDEMFWPQVVRGAAVALCILPPTRFALGLLPLERVGDASGLYNLCRNLGGAIGLSLLLGLDLLSESHDAYDRRAAVATAAVERHFTRTLVGSAGITSERSHIVERSGRRTDNTLLGLPVTLAWDKSDDLLNPTRGFRLNSAVTVHATLAAVEQGAGQTELQIHTESSIMGKLGEFGQAVMRKKADQMVEEFARNMAKAITDAGVLL